MPYQNAPLFNKYVTLYPEKQRSQETLLVEDLLEEAISFHAIPAWYIVRESEDEVDLIFGEDSLKKFERAYKLPMYVEKVDSFQGNSEIFTYHGLEIQDSTTTIISRRTFNRVVPNINGLDHPREGDLVFIPTFNKLFEIKFVDEEAEFFVLGKGAMSPYIYKLSLETFKYSQEVIDTGVDEIDAVRENNAYSFVLYLSTGSGNYIIGERVYQGSNLASSTASAEVKAWNAANSELQIFAPKGFFAIGSNVVGANSATTYNLSNYDDADISNVLQEVSDNVLVKERGNQDMDLSEQNPLGGPN